MKPGLFHILLIALLIPMGNDLFAQRNSRDKKPRKDQHTFLLIGETFQRETIKNHWFEDTVSFSMGHCHYFNPYAQPMQYQEWNEREESTRFYHYENGYLTEGFFQDTNFAGTTIMEAHFVRGTPHGEAVVWIDGGLETRGKFDQGERTGKWVYQSTGSAFPLMIHYFSPGQRHQDSTFVYNEEKGFLTEKRVLKDRHHYQYVVNYFPNGDTLSIVRLLDLKARTYTYREWHPNGNLKTTGERMWNGVIWKDLGLWEEYDSEGKLISTKKIKAQ